MEPTRGISPIERVLFFGLRLLLWPVASFSPSSSWARMYKRLGALGDDETPRDVATPQRPRGDRPPLVPMGVFVALIAAAVALWVWDVVRDPKPAPAPGHHALTVSSR